MKRSKIAIVALSSGSLCAALGLLIGGRSASAQIDRHPPIIVPPWPRPPRPPLPPPSPALQELRLDKQNAKVEIKNGMARVVLTQTLTNIQSRTVEGEFLWAVPVGAAISEFSMTSNGKKLSAEILEKERAREIYNGIVRKWRDPAILEFIDRDLLRAKLFPIPANGSIEVELTYSQPLKASRFVLPLKSPNSASAGRSGNNNVKSSVQVVLAASKLKAVLSPSHQIEVKRDGDKATIHGEFTGESRDFSLLWTRGEGAVGVELQTYKPSGEDAYFMLLAAPDTGASTPEVANKEVVFVFDTSGSMDGAKIEQARRAMKTLLSNLRPTDKFGIVTFSSSAKTFRDELVNGTPQNIAAARSFADEIRAIGGTNIEEALQTATKLGDSSNKSRQVIFLTDGQPTVGETKVQPLLDGAKKESKNARIWTFGLGFDVNTRLLDSLAEENGGASDYVLPEEDIEQKVGDLYGKIAYPILQNTSVNWGGASVYDVYPRQYPELFRGGQMVILGRLKGDARNEVALEGELNGAKRRFDGTVSKDGTNEIAKLWATRKIGFLIDDARRSGKPIEGEIKTEILALSQKYGVVSPLTAALITEDEAPTPISGRPPITRGPVFDSSRDNRSSGGFGGGFGSAPAAMGNVLRNRTESGQSAVITSKATKEMREGIATDQKAANIQIIGGKTFVLRENQWTDEEFTTAKFPRVREVKAYSDEYFELAKTPEIARWLSLGENVIFIWKGEAIRIS
jgi:Ca-activated chloride channel family protein